MPTDILYLLTCYLISAGKFGAATQADFRKQPRPPVQIAATSILGLAVPPAMCALLLYFARQVTHDRDRPRERAGKSGPHIHHHEKGQPAVADDDDDDDDDDDETGTDDDETGNTGCHTRT
jgi:hypothetical protein